jgi:hypothetical protein
MKEIKIKKSVALPPIMYQWAKTQCDATGESFSAYITRLLIKEKGKK